jgi:hypothetical protein
VDWQNQHGKNGYTAKSNLYVQHNTHHNPNDNHHRDWKISPKVYLEAQKTMNSLGNTEQKEQCWSYHNAWLQTTLQSDSNKTNMVLVQKQIWSQWNRIEDMDMNPHNYAHLICDKHAICIRWRRQPIQKMLLGKLDLCLQKTETRDILVTHTIINSKWIKELNIRPETLKLV